VLHRPIETASLIGIWPNSEAALFQSGRNVNFPSGNGSERGNAHEPHCVPGPNLHPHRGQRMNSKRAFTTNTYRATAIAHDNETKIKMSNNLLREPGKDRNTRTTKQKNGPAASAYQFAFVHMTFRFI
jgi:hypothetical protein